MSKRVANTTDKYRARNGRVRLGWRRSRQINQLEEMQKQALLANKTPSVQETLTKIGSLLGKLRPKKMIRRHQGR